MPSKRLGRTKDRRLSSFIILIVLLILIISIESCIKRNKNEKSLLETDFKASQTTQLNVTKQKEYPKITEDTAAFDAKVNALNAVLIDVENNTILAERDSDKRIYPASLTKIMTLIVATENITDLNDTFIMTHDILYPLYLENATMAGFLENEEVKLIDLLYGAILPSGADATVALARKISGTESNFVALMNEKANSLGLKNTHFVNTSGLHDANHYSTPVDIAMMLDYALQNELCKKILSTYQYTTAPTPQHPEGIKLESTMFSRMYGTEVENVTILGGKTGYTLQSGHCLASYAVKNGKTYIAVTTGGTGKYKPIYDSFEIYGNYLK